MATVIDYKDRCITFFGQGYFNEKTGKVGMQVHPQQLQNIYGTGTYIKSEWCAGRQTATLRQMIGHCSDQEIKLFKLLYFENALFSGVFKYRNAKGLIRRSPFMCIDIDDIESETEVLELKQSLIKDKEVETALCFVSPSGRGLKWIIELPEWTDGLSYREQYLQISIHVGFHYGYRADPACVDVCRGCYLPYDPDCFINQKYYPNLKNLQR